MRYCLFFCTQYQNPGVFCTHSACLLGHSRFRCSVATYGAAAHTACVVIILPSCLDLQPAWNGNYKFYMVGSKGQI